MNLLTRQEFVKQVTERDNNICVACKNVCFSFHDDIKIEIHHIMDRSLFEDGGYYLDNGVTLCSHCHLTKAENTLYSPKRLRELANIKNIILPPHLDSNYEYDKWGNTILPNGMRLKGELYYQPNVQKMLSLNNLQRLFLKWVKFPRTYHFPWSPNLQNDDRMLQTIEQFIGKEVIVTIKMDGENTSCYPDYIHARSIDSKDHESRHWMKRFHASFKYEIPENWIVCGENLYAKHSIHYKNLNTYFQVFAIWNETMNLLSWKEIEEWCDLLNLVHVPVFYKGIFSKELIENEFQKYIDNSEDEVEGYVVRIADSFHYNDYNKFVGKVVRKNHVQSSKFWMKEQVIPNELKKG